MDDDAEYIKLDTGMWHRVKRFRSHPGAIWVCMTMCGLWVARPGSRHGLMGPRMSDQSASRPAGSIHKLCAKCDRNARNAEKKAELLRQEKAEANA